LNRGNPIAAALTIVMAVVVVILVVIFIQLMTSAIG